MVLPPMLKEAYDDREYDCQLALEMYVQEAVDEAVAAGWDRAEAIAAVANVALNFLAAEAANRKTDFRVAQALGRVEH